MDLLGGIDMNAGSNSNNAPKENALDFFNGGGGPGNLAGGALGAAAQNSGNQNNGGMFDFNNQAQGSSLAGSDPFGPPQQQ